LFIQPLREGDVHEEIEHRAPFACEASRPAPRAEQVDADRRADRAAIAMSASAESSTTRTDRRTLAVRGQWRCLWRSPPAPSRPAGAPFVKALEQPRQTPPAEIVPKPSRSAWRVRRRLPAGRTRRTAAPSPRCLSPS
jgi:hypothetical protein